MSVVCCDKVSSKPIRNMDSDPLKLVAYLTAVTEIEVCGGYNLARVVS